MDDTRPKVFLFVLMPFDSKFADIYEFGIKQACKDSGAYCERVDEQIFTESILDRIYNQIAKADIIVADMTGRNPNVFYETGYAHALNKRVILLTQDAKDIPFDLQHYPHIIYGGSISSLKSQLQLKIRWCIDNPRESLQEAETNIQLYIDGMPLVEKPTVLPNNYGKASIKIDIYNLSTRILNSTSFNLALVTPIEASIDPYIVSSKSKLPDGCYIYNLEYNKIIFPGGWGSLEFMFWLRSKIESPREIILRSFTELGPKDYVFTIAYGSM